MKIRMAYPGGLIKALTFSFDDGGYQDIRLQEIFNKYHLKSTFNLNSGMLGNNRSLKNKHGVHRMTKEEVENTYQGHEVAIHTRTHPNLVHLTNEMIINEVYEDRKALENIFDYPIRGMAYPYGTYDKRLIEILKTLGISYSRTTKSTYNYELPEEFLTWHPTCHYKEDKTNELIDNYINLKKDYITLLYIWGHSFELDKFNHWDLFEKYAKKLGDHDDIWYATNIEFYEYIDALKKLVFSCDNRIVYNSTAIDLWLLIDDKPIEIKYGETIKLI